MERKIKFRAWLEDDGHVMKYNKEKVDFPVMQYTGFKDKNGVEIYEGDILTKSNGKPFTVIHKKGAIDFNEAAWDWEYGSGFYFDENPKDSEVVGNVYENHS